jgi:hypothetical protein
MTLLTLLIFARMPYYMMSMFWPDPEDDADTQDSSVE